MKILVMSLLRIGDVILTTPTLAGLKHKYPNCQIHLLLNRECQPLAPLLKDADRIHYFERSRVQLSLGQADRSLLEGFAHVRGLIAELREEQFDFAVNLTHTRLSGWLAGLLNCDVRAGLVIGAHAKPRIASPWFRYLNELSSEAGQGEFHFADVFFYGSGLMGPTLPYRLQETARGVQECSTLVTSKPFIAIQPFTSDSKKTWTGFPRMLELLRIFQPEYELVLLGAPNEKQRLSNLVAELALRGVPSRPAVCSLEGVLSLIAKAKLLITGDTSIKHIGCATQTPIVEIAIGSADPAKTGAFSPQSVVVQTVESCAPCAHAKGCHQSSHLCGDAISSDLIALVCSHTLQHNWLDLRTIAREYEDQARILQTTWSETGLWQMLPFASNFTRDEVQKIIERTSRQLFLHSQQSDKLKIDWRTHGTNLLEHLCRVFPDRSRYDWIQVLGDIEQALKQSQTKAGDLQMKMDLESRMKKMKHQLEENLSKKPRDPLDAAWILLEILKEQLGYENPRPATRPPR